MVPKTERLLNLVICLLHTRSFLTQERIAEIVPGYADGEEAARHKRFERDKFELRQLGVPLESGPTETGVEGYRIRRDAYELPPITLDREEAAAVALAARLWQSAPLEAATSSALLKLRAAGVAVDETPGLLEPRVAAAEPAFTPVLKACRDRYPIAFDYRAANRTETERREVEPWGVVSWRGRWYLVAHDRARDARRVFRLSRVASDPVGLGPPGSVDVPADLDLRATVAELAGAEPREEAVLAVRAGTGWELRRVATAVTPGAAPGGRDEVRVSFSDPERLALQVAQYAADVVALGPPSLREAVLRRLRAAAGQEVA